MDDQEKKDEYKIRRERVVRWDNYRLNQFSYTNNLFIVLNFTFLGFYIARSGFEFNSNCLLKVLQVLTLLFVVTSFFIGVLTTLNRLQDFRKTAQLTKQRKKRFEQSSGIKNHSDIQSIEKNIISLEEETRDLGLVTWTLLRLQIWTFVIGSILGVLYLITESNTSG